MLIYVWVVSYLFDEKCCYKELRCKSCDILQNRKNILKGRSDIEVLVELNTSRPRLKAALFDFDGTISTLRYGWEAIMEPLMLEMIAGKTKIDSELMDKVREYIDQSTGIQTIYQMQWLADTVKTFGRNLGASEDPWWYKAEYNRRLMEIVEKRKKSILNGQMSVGDFLIKGSEEFLAALAENGIEIYLASGTDHEDVVTEAKALGLCKYFKEIAGAPAGRADCSKKAIMRRLINETSLIGSEVVVIGDGKVEIMLGREVGAITLGVASNEDLLFGVNPVKRERLAKAGAHAIIGDFGNVHELLSWIDLF